MCDFVAGLTARHDPAARMMAQTRHAATGFAPAHPCQGTTRPTPASSGPASGSGPRHFSPADPNRNPTAGWDPLDPTAVELPVPVADLIDDAADRVAAAHVAGYAEGLAAAVGEAGERDRALLADLADQIAGGGHINRALVAEHLRQTVLMLVSKVVGDVGIAPDILACRIESAADHLADSSESALLRVHPDDVALLDGRLPATMFAVGDPHVARGSFVIETASTVVEDGPALWLEQLEQAIDRVPVPAC